MIDGAIVPENIGALSAIYFASMVDELKAFDVADRLVDLYLNGLLPIGQPGGRNLLDGYWKNASARMSSAERRGLYTRAFGVPGGDPASPQNRDFNELWMRFVSSVSVLARQHAADPVLGSSDPCAAGREQMRKAGRDLALNLSLHGFGLAGVASEIARQVDDLIDVLSDSEIQQAYGARDVWQLVERVSALELGGSRPCVRRVAMAESGAVVFTWLAGGASTLAGTAGDALDRSDLGNKQRSDRPTTHPTDYDLVNACERWLAAAVVADAQIEKPSQPLQTPLARDAVWALLARSAAFAGLPPAVRTCIARDMAQIADYLAARETAEAFAALADEVDFPAFVGDLIEGVFDAIVDASISQMEAYADLLDSVAASLEKFRDANVSDIQLRDRLCEQFPALCERVKAGGGALGPPPDTLAAGVLRRLATTRQQLLATLVMTGINRIAGSGR